MEYREELKFIIKQSEINVLETRLKGIMRIDSNSKKNSSYNIRSIYFDDYSNSCFYENESGLDKRLKLRIRIYNHNRKLIKLEIKYKNHNLTKKEVCNINEDLCDRLIRGEKIRIDELDNRVLNKLYIYQQTRLLVPKIIVEYDRIAYTSKLGNVRVTFDTNIRASKYVDRFFDKNLYAVPVLNKGFNVLEVKYDELLPDYIAKTLETKKLSQTAFSKYYLSRIRLKEEVV